MPAKDLGLQTPADRLRLVLRPRRVAREWRPYRVCVPVHSWPCRLWRGASAFLYVTVPSAPSSARRASEQRDCDRSLRKISACLGRSGTAASANRRSALATIAAQASAPRTIVTAYGVPGDKAWGAAPARACRPGLHGKPANHRCGVFPADRRWRSSETLRDPTYRPTGRNPTRNSSRSPQERFGNAPEQPATWRRRPHLHGEPLNPRDAGLVPPFQPPGDGQTRFCPGLFHRSHSSAFCFQVNNVRDVSM